ncbi:hypothetical protein COY89_01985 [Candidatus Roizmanbacteria bacterium CG_4_10_14_0_8_um_filter_36_36]|uniref:Uncharacterized protein n=1 Tax=Candidatus Roizmanbacteria bacterium CG_4_8_14_3_um_filter_36_10 TaxID=1974834 RepID=A0A2M8GMR1_9BACT|nr:MAG: hypothetical protein COY89_01985 [Candidatus Roizmanbacteria bacterium CG_4_10_14_0_8_um_filter_36_36]PJA53361.1 MAG: hypothetical protein CO166_02085 [Candidatus Roizmanbacteria bacterium CG_4_9_14_3_um_filter_36_11]PJC81779.1 MAG: hypothetical protein CO007_02930 [Candidatus Roizmanbacteria bacterium CG_4_8_14_3_um_filter_36_10]
MNNLNLQPPNFIDKIQSAAAIDLNSSKTYKMKTKPERKTGKPSVCLFTSTENKISKRSQSGNDYFLVFRLDFSKLNKNNDPLLKIDLYDINDKKLKIGEQPIHRIDKQLNNNMWTYKVEGYLKYRSNIIPINFNFQIKTTIRLTISMRARVRK